MLFTLENIIRIICNDTITMGIPQKVYYDLRKVIFRQTMLCCISNIVQIVAFQIKVEVWLNRTFHSKFMLPNICQSCYFTKLKYNVDLPLYFQLSLFQTLLSSVKII